MTTSKIVCLCEEEGSWQPLCWRIAKGSPGLAGGQGQRPTFPILVVPSAVRLPASAWFRSLIWKCKTKDNSFCLHFYLTFWSKGLGIPLGLKVFFSGCSLSIKAKTLIYQVNIKFQWSCREYTLQCPGEAGKPLPVWVKLCLGHSSKVSHSIDRERQPALPTEQQLKTTQ